MDKLKEKLESQLENFISMLPKSDSTVSGHKNRIKAVLNLKDDYLKKVNQIGNDFVIENNSTEKEIENIKEICQFYLDRFLVGFN